MHRSIHVIAVSILFSATLLVALAPVSARAQTAAPPAGITVTGYGEASAPAEVAMIQFLISRGQFEGPPSLPQPGTTPGAEERTQLASIADAITAAQPEADPVIIYSPVVGDFFGPTGPGVGRIDVRLAQPDRDELTALIAEVAAAAAEQRLVVGQVGVSYDIADCLALERQAREAALADARQRAQVQAELLNVQLGEVVAAMDNAAYLGSPPSGGSCAPPVPTAIFGAPGLSITLPAFDPTKEVEAAVYAQISLTFAIAA